VAKRLARPSAQNSPFERAAARSVPLVVALVLAAAFVAAAVRLLPWLLDARVPIHATLPFARGLMAIAVEVAILVGWPVGWALAAQSLVERGEALVLLTLGERPERTLARLWPHAAVLSALLACASLVGGRDAREPGRVVTELLEEGTRACAGATAPKTFSIPFLGTTWVCQPGTPPRLAGPAPGALSGLYFSARAARVADDLRRVELDDARLAIGHRADRVAIIHVGALAIHGMPPWAQASTLPSWLRAILLTLSGVLAAALAARAALLRPFAPRGRIHAIAVGAAGPLAALAALRLLERTEAGAVAYALVPLSSAVGALGLTYAVRLLLPLERAATK
jgi:hypothetical protein